MKQLPKSEYVIFIQKQDSYLLFHSKICHPDLFVCRIVLDMMLKNSNLSWKRVKHIMFLEGDCFHILGGGRCPWVSQIQLEAEVFNPPDIFPLIPIVNKLCNIERCVNNMLQIIQNMMVSQGSELELSMFRWTTLSGQHPLI